MKNKKAGTGGVIMIILILLAILLGWGYVGGQEAQKIGVTCDMGLDETFCWKWHTNVLGSVREGILDIFRGGG